MAIATHNIFADLNCEIAAGKFTCLLGPSGVGKSTLLHMLADIIEIQNAKISGTIKADDNLPLQDRIAYMGQTDLLLPWLSVLNNTLLGARLRHQVDTEKNKQKYCYNKLVWSTRCISARQLVNAATSRWHVH